jgi:hypothetical protein
MKPSAKRAELFTQGKIILRPMIRRGRNKTNHAVAFYTGCGWANWIKTKFYKTEAGAIHEIERAVKILPDLYIDDRTIT